ncbi:MAG: hypothetical protein ACHRXM_18685 [Isosphaerales bacterium]
MSHDAEVLGSQSRAIADFREEILLWIDTALVRLREREQEESLVMEEKSAPAALTRLSMERGSQTQSRARRPGVSLGGTELEPVMRWEGTRNTGEIAGPDSLSDPARPPIVAPRPEAGTKSKSLPLDSLTRLDALARLLDQRLKVSQEAASNSYGASGEVGESNG